MTRASRSELATEALEKSLEVREAVGSDFVSPICPYASCEKLGVHVRSVADVSMEGVYVRLKVPTVILSSLRPLGRRAFTCAHELGHHVFDHGSTIDELKAEGNRGRLEPKEFLADAFAAYFLLPVQGVRRAFAERKVNPLKASPRELLVVASAFGVGFDTLVSHLQYSLKSLTSETALPLHRNGLDRAREEVSSPTG